jgi:hypothetical protein
MIILSSMEQTVINGFKIAHPEDTGMRCPRCETPVSLKKWTRVGPQAASNGIRCYLCKGNEKLRDSYDSYFAPDTAKMGVTADSAPLLDDTEAHAAVWFHATHKRNWFDEIQTIGDAQKGNLLVHVGMKATALARIKDALWDKRLHGPQTYYLHEIRLKPEAVLHHSVLNDDNRWPPFSASFERTHGTVNAARYVNRWETPGSISMLVDATMIELTKTIERRFAQRKARR